MRLILLGFSCSGKSTLSKTLGKIYSINVYHLDEFYWKYPWVKNDNFDIADILAKPNWIIDGNYFENSFIERLDLCDAIIYLDCPLTVRLSRMIIRHIRFQFNPEKGNPVSQKITSRFLLKTIYKHIIWQPQILKFLQNNLSQKFIYIKNIKYIQGKECEYFEKSFYKLFNSNN